MKYTLLSFFLFLGVILSSCSKNEEEIAPLIEYYITLESVKTNLIDSNGKSIGNQLLESFHFSNGQKYISIVTTNNENDAWDYYYKAKLDIYTSLCNDLQASLPDNGWIEYYFAFRKENKTGIILSEDPIEIKPSPFKPVQ